MEPSTKRFLASLTAEGYASSRSRFVVPCPDGRPLFVDTGSGQEHELAYVVYVGGPITADDVLRKFAGWPGEPARLRRLAVSLIHELQGFRIGNVVAVECSDGERVRLRLVANAPKARRGPKLPK